MSALSEFIRGNNRFDVRVEESLIIITSQTAPEELGVPYQGEKDEPGIFTVLEELSGEIDYEVLSDISDVVSGVVKLNKSVFTDHYFQTLVIERYIQHLAYWANHNKCSLFVYIIQSEDEKRLVIYTGFEGDIPITIVDLQEMNRVKSCGE
jgi:hypothetical protein